MNYSDDTVIEFLNSIVRKHKLKHKRKKVLDPATKKSSIPGNSGVGYGPDKIDA